MSDDEAARPDDEAPVPEDGEPTPPTPRAGRRPSTLGVLVGLALGLVVGLTMGVVVGITGFTPEEPPPGPVVASSQSGPVDPSAGTSSGPESGYLTVPGTVAVPGAVAAPLSAPSAGSGLVSGLAPAGSYPAGSYPAGSSSSTERAQRLRYALTATGIPTVGSGEFETTLAAGICDRFASGDVSLAQLAQDTDAAVVSFDPDLARRFVDVAVASYCS